MFSFFYSIYMALFTGSWQVYELTPVRETLTTAWNDVTNWLMNCLGGNFQAVQTYEWTTDPAPLWALVLALVTITLVCVLVFKLVKGVFWIFFGGR